MPPRQRTGLTPLSRPPDPDLARWHDNVARGSAITADVYTRRLAAFCRQMRVEPTVLPTLPQKGLRDLLLDFVSAEEKKGRAGSYIQSSLKAVRSWLAHSGVKLTLPVRVKGVSDTPTLRDERTPTQEELRAILLAATPRDRVSCALMAFAGVRPEVLGNYHGNDGLRVSDLKDLEITEIGVEITKVPALVEVRKELSKAGHRYFTFLGKEGCEYVQQYLEERRRSGERLSPETDLIHPKGTGWSRDKTFVTTINVGDGIRNAVRNAGFSWRPYVLRAYFDTQALLAESKGKLAHDYRVFWMGHKGSMEARYTTHKGRLPTEMIEDMRGAYGRCEPFLSTTPTASNSDRDLVTRKVVLRMHGYSEEELTKIDISSKTDDELIALADAKRLENQRAVGAAQVRPGQKAVPIAEVGGMLESGWEYVASLGPDRAVLRGPGHALTQ